MSVIIAHKKCYVIVLVEEGKEKEKEKLKNIIIDENEWNAISTVIPTSEPANGMKSFHYAFVLVVSFSFPAVRRLCYQLNAALHIFLSSMCPLQNEEKLKHTEAKQMNQWYRPTQANVFIWKWLLIENEIHRKNSPSPSIFYIRKSEDTKKSIS